MGSITEGAENLVGSIREKIKLNAEKRKSDELFDLIHAKLTDDAIKSGKGEDELKTLEKKIQAMKKVGFSVEETIQAGQVMAPDLFNAKSPKNIYVQGNEGAPRFMGQVPGGSEVFKENLTPEQIGAREQARQNVKVSEPTAEMKQGAMNLESQIQNFDAAMKLFNSAPQGVVSGNIAGAAGALTGGKANTAGKVYADILPALSASLYKDMTGDTRLSDADAKARAYPLFPKQGDDPKLNKLKEQFIRSTLERRQAQYASGDFSPMSQAQIMDEFVKFIASGGKEDKKAGQLQKLGLDPNKFEIVDE